MTRKGTKKGTSVTLPDSWFVAVDRYRRERAWTYKLFGAALAPFSGEPVPISTLQAYLKDRKGVTEELTIAIAHLTGLPPPPMGEQSGDPEIAAFADLGRQLKIEAPELFRQQLGTIRSLVDALKRKRDR